MILIRRNDDSTFSFIKSDFVVDIGDYFITSICSSDQGRIFLGSQNYNLYELDYSVILLNIFYNEKIITFYYT